ncbi:nitroreductase family protein [Kitasatospora cinereorecta]|uniref:Nitroreductase family protein n=1 Tax=Kitasatospora cinereorecta TaxID=285560 RepID=A0ABW0V8Z1_9ACTN
MRTDTDRENTAPAAHGHDCRPRLRRGIAVTPLPAGLVVEAVGRRHLFRGEAATATLPRLFALLDGTRDAAALAAELGHEVAAIEPVLAAVEARALLEPTCPATAAAPVDGAPQAADAVAEFLARTGPVAAVEGGSVTALARLAASTVAVAGPPAVTERIAEDLRACGVGRVTAVEPGDAPVDGPVDLLVVCDDDPRLLAAAVRHGAAGGFEVLRYAVRDAAHAADATGAIEIGPRFRPGHTACADCLRTGRAREFPADRVPSVLSPAVVDLAAGLVADQVTAALAGTAVPLPRRELRRLTLPDFSTRYLAVVPEPGCLECGPIGDGPEQEADTIEWLLQASPPERYAAGAGVAPFEPLPVLDLPASPRRPLTAPAPADCTPGVPDERALAVLLSRTAGPRETAAGGGAAEDGAGIRRRWAPSGGNLGSVQLFLLTEEHWPGLPGTVFRYDAEAGELVAARADAPPLSALLAGTALAGRPVRAALVFTGALHRLWGKYHQFSPRLTHLDTGCAMAQAALVAGELGLHAELAAGDVGALAEHLELNPVDQLVTGIVGIYGKDHADAARRPA